MRYCLSWKIKKSLASSRRPFSRPLRPRPPSLAECSSTVGAWQWTLPISGYKYRIAFGCWINDMRSEALPLQQWPAPHLDEITVSSMLAAMDVQAKAGFNYLDAWGLFATYGYPPDITSAFTDPLRTFQVKRLIREAESRGITYLFGMGLFSWGYDQIIRADPSVRGKNKSGQPLDHVMCGATEKAWSYVEKILDTALSEFRFRRRPSRIGGPGLVRLPVMRRQVRHGWLQRPAQHPGGRLHQAEVAGQDRHLHPDQLAGRLGPVPFRPGRARPDHRAEQAY